MSKTVKQEISSRISLNIPVKESKANKLAQYFRILPCPYAQQIFCYASCVLKWFKMEQTRLETLAMMQETAKQGSQKPVTDGEAQVDDNVEVTGQQAVSRAPNDDPVPDAPPEETTEIPVDIQPNEVGEVVAEEETAAQSAAEASPNEPTGESNAVVDLNVEGDLAPAIENNVPVEDTGPNVALTKPAILKIPYANSTERRLSWNLAFASMKYFEILDKIIEEVGFYSEYPDLRDEEYLVLVTLYDYTARTYQRRTKTDADTEILPPAEEARPAKFAGRVYLYPPTTELFQEVEKAVMQIAVHFAGAVARIRVKEQVGSLRFLLPEEWRKAEAFAEIMPFYAWYNQLLGKREVVITWLKENNFTKVNGRMPRQGEYTTDLYCHDVFIFNSFDRAVILESNIVEEKNLIVQDRSNLVAIHSILSFVGSGEEVLFGNTVNNFCGIHMEGLISNKFPMVQPVPMLRICRQPKESEDPKMVNKYGAKSIKLLTDDFLTLNFQSDQFKGVRHILIEASDTRCAVASPIDYIDCESDEITILKEMATPVGNPQKETKQLEYIARTTSLLKHALKFSQARTISFLSHSSNNEETENLVMRVLEYTNRNLLREAEAAVTSSRNLTTTPAYVIRLPLIQAFTDAKTDLDEGRPSVITENDAIRFPASEEGNGFYLACFKKELVMITQPEEEHPSGLEAEDEKAKGGPKKGKGKKGKK